MTTPTRAVQQYGQSIWYDFISRELLLSGELRRLVEHDGVRGVTSNPAIFEKAIASGHDYDPAIHTLVGQGARDPKGIFESLATVDVQLACDVLRGVYDESAEADGFVSLEVSPHLAHDTEGTIEEARRLWRAVGRPNLMIKVPATRAGLPAIETLIGEGIHVNATLLFAVDYYEQVHNAYIAGLERFAAAGGALEKVSSVASFFVSRIDARIEKQIVEELSAGGDPDRKARLEGLIFKVAIANAVDAYGRFQDTLQTERWKKLDAQGARPQRVLWASTGTKSPDLPPTLYVDKLIGRDTVNTVPAATFEAFKSEGTVSDALSGDEGQRIREEATEMLATVTELGLSLEAVTDELLDQGCQLFCDAFDQLLEAVAKKRDELTEPQ
ncbi:MAG: transaldolase [bacterium TMED88]|nr:transaldolase [Deltaproteobacteria bacterium]OUV28877.1 MAG: transaldolase [bacterium TMED88]